MFTLLFCFLLSAQPRQILGQAVETKSKSPIVFATVSIKNSNLGVIADQDGYFRLPYRYKQRRDTIVITAIGYKKTEVALWNLKDDKVNVINIDIQTEALDVVDLTFNKKKRKRRLTARQIVKRAIDNIPNNLPSQPHSYVGYYRDYKLLDNEYINLNEGIIEVFDAGIQTKKFFDPLNQSALYSYNLNETFKRDNFLEIPYDNRNIKYVKGAKITSLGGNELSILDIHNPIRNYNIFSFSFINTLKKDFIRNHRFKLIRKTSINTTPIYEIEFKQLDAVVGPQYKITGKIYIQINNFAIHKIEYDGKQSKTINIDRFDYGGFKEQIDYDYKPFYSLKLEYVPIGEYMYLNYISFNNRFRLGSSADFRVEDVFYESSENAFFIRFNTPLLLPFGQKLNQKVEKIRSNKYSIDNFSFKYKNTFLNLNSIQVIDGQTIKINLKKDQLPSEIEKSDEIMKDIKYLIFGVRDKFKRELNDKKILNIFQFREFFVQEVFPKKELQKNVEFVNKTKHLSESSIINSKSALKYWVNTPLKKIKE